MTLVLAGVALGLVSSTHCVLMCGPLVRLAQRGASVASLAAFGRSMSYHAGRALGYALAGALVGRLGDVVTGAGGRGVLATAIGVALVATAFASALGRTAPGVQWWSRHVMPVAAVTMRRLDGHRWTGAAGLGAVNALLPCGLLYAALAAAAALGSGTRGAAFMLAFGVGTTPALAAVTLAPLPWSSRLMARLSPIAVGLVGLLLVARGLGLALPAAHSETAHRPHVSHQAPAP